jgi:hypothetical protein
MDTKTCTKCRDTKPVSGFFKDKRNTGPKGKGVASHCKECQVEKHRKWYDDNKDYYAQYNKDYYRANKPRYQATHRRLKYGITQEQYDTLLQKQDGKCAICGSTDPKGKGVFHVDHNHETGEVRGLLCHFCNVGIGNLQDDPSLLRKAADYLTIYTCGENQQD